MSTESRPEYAAQKLAAAAAGEKRQKVIRSLAVVATAGAAGILFTRRRSTN